MKFSIKDCFSKCDQIRRNLQIWLHSLKKSLMENFIFCAVTYGYGYQSHGENAFHNLLKFYLGLKSPNMSFTERWWGKYPFLLPHLSCYQVNVHILYNKFMKYTPPLPAKYLSSVTNTFNNNCYKTTVLIVSEISYFKETIEL